MKKIIKTISIEIKNLEVENGYYSFDYYVDIDDDVKLEKIYESDYEGWDDDEFKEFLENGYALKQAFEHFTEEYNF